MDNLRGIAFMVAGMALFAVTDSIIKLLSEDFPLGQIVMVLGIGGLIAVTPPILRSGVGLTLADARQPAVMIRNLAEAIGTVSIALALALTPISQMSAILQAGPLLLTVGGAVFFGEAVGWRRWSAVLVGLVGVMVILRPGAEGFDLNSLFAVAAVLALSVRDLGTRGAPRSIGSYHLSAYAFITLIPTGAAVMAVTGGWTIPDFTTSALLVFMVSTSTAGYLLVVLSMRMGEVSAVAPFRYSRLIFALVVGYFIFGEEPDRWMLAGSALVIGSGIYTLHRERIVRARARREAAVAAGRPQQSPAAMQDAR